jgi:hypothetical protein
MRVGEGHKAGGACLRRHVGRLVHLPLRRLVLRELPSTFRALLWRVPARVQLCGRSAVRRSAALPVVGLDGPVGAAHEQFCDRVGMAFARGQVQRRVPDPADGGDSAAHPADATRKRRTSSDSGHRRRPWRRSVIGRFGDCRGPPPCAAQCIHPCARRGRGKGWALRGIPTQPVPVNKTALGPEDQRS